MDFYYQGIPIEVTTRSIEKMKSTIFACLDGKFEITPAAWTTNGYYSYIYLSELSFIKPIDDSYGLITSLKGYVSPYPPKLKQGIIEHFWWRATLWIDKFHYLSAIEREDILFTSGIIKNSLYDLIQIIFALNEVYFKGDKKLLEQLNELDYCPSLLLTHIEFLLSAPSDVTELKKQREILMQIIEDVKVHLT